MAFGQTPHVLWEVDIEKRTFNTYNVNTQTCAQDTMLENFPEAMIESGMIHLSSAANFRLFADALLEGNGAGSGNFIMRDGKKRLLRMGVHVLPDDLRQRREACQGHWGRGKASGYFRHPSGAYAQAPAARDSAPPSACPHPGGYHGRFCGRPLDVRGGAHRLDLGKIL